MLDRTPGKPGVVLVCFPCLQHRDIHAGWQRIEAAGRACNECGERPQGLWKGLARKCTDSQPFEARRRSRHRAAEYHYLEMVDPDAAFKLAIQESLLTADASALSSTSTCATTPVGNPDSGRTTSGSSAALDSATPDRRARAVSGSSDEDPQRHPAGGAPALELVAWLRPWLDSVGLSHHLDEAAAWCDSMGAADVAEVLENYEEFAGHLQLTEAECSRLCGDSAAPEEDSQGARRDSGDEDYVMTSVAHANYETFGPPEAQYTILEPLGRGATATVYRCVRGEDQYAVKVIDIRRIRMRPHFQQMLHIMNRETSLLFKLRHDKIVRLHDVVETTAMRFLVMDLLEGGDLFNYILSKGPLAEREARCIFWQIVEGLKYIHSEDVVHRDLKPENILIDSATSRPDFISIKISDFGHSKGIRDGYTCANTCLGTPHFWAPEVSNVSWMGAKSYDERADLWSLGVLLYFMLMGMYPFSDSTLKGFRSANLSFQGSRETEEIVRGLIRIDPAERLTLDQCLRSPWLACMRSAEVCREPCDNQPKLRVRLPRAPARVSSLKAELIEFACRHKAPANLRMLDVVVSFGPDAAEDAMCRAREELIQILVRHVPELERQERMSGPRPAPVDDQAAAAWAEECESLQAILDSEFKVVSAGEWLVRVKDGVMLRIVLPPAHTRAEPPTLVLEALEDYHSTFPPSLTDELLARWTPGSACIYDWVLRLRDALPDTRQACSEDTTPTSRSDRRGVPPEEAMEARPPCVREAGATHALSSTFTFAPLQRGARGQRGHVLKFGAESLNPCHRVEIRHGEPVVDRKSTFQAHGALVTCAEQVEWVRRELLAGKKASSASHNFVAYRFWDNDRNRFVVGYNDDNEKGAGNQLATLLQSSGAKDVFVMVSRWYGGIKLGPNRFKTMKIVAQRLLNSMQLTSGGPCS